MKQVIGKKAGWKMTKSEIIGMKISRSGLSFNLRCLCKPIIKNINDPEGKLSKLTVTMKK